MRACLLFFLVSGALAQEQQAPSDPVKLAIDEGYAPRPAEEPAGSLLGGVLALGPGLFVHGVGHYYAGDQDAALSLLLAEVTGLVLVVGGQLIGVATNESGEAGLAQQVLTHSGLLLFAGSWGADIVGTFKGAEPFDPDSTRTKGTRVAIGYRYLTQPSDPENEFAHNLVGRLELDTGFVYIRPEGSLEVTLQRGTGLLDVGLRVLRGSDPHNYLALGSRIGRKVLVAHSLANWTTEGYLEFKLDLGMALSNLRQFFIVNRTGYGWEFVQLRPQAGRVPGLFAESDFDEAYFVIESGIEVNSGRNTHLSFMVVQDPTDEVAPLARALGIFRIGLVHRYSSTLDIGVDLAVGDGLALDIALGYGL